MKINTISFSIVKNESDIIETFVRHNLNYVERMVIADNLSTDNTLKILYALKKEGLPLDIVIDDNPAHDQSEKTSLLYFMFAEKYSFRQAFFLDADEFICGERMELDTFHLPGSVFDLPIKSYVMEEFPSPNLKAPLSMRYCFRNYYTYGKKMLIHDVSDYKNYIISDGNHHIVYKGTIVESQPIQLYLAHIPIRSKEQFLSKAIMGRIGLGLRDKRDKKTGEHWINHFEFLKKHEFSPSDTDLVEYLYNVSNMDEFIHQATEYEPILWNFSLKYGDWIKPVNILNSVLDSYIKNCGLD